jgi:rare lipoprotein A
MFAMTAAHKTLPFGTLVRVTDTNTGNSVDVRINDRGVLPGNHVIDLSYGAAKRLDILRTGVVNVKLQILAMGSSRHTIHQQ